MCKYILLICLLSLINFTNSSSNNTFELTNETFDILYDYLVDIMAGMSTNATYSFCSNIFKEKKPKIKNDIFLLINQIINGEFNIITSSSLILKIVTEIEGCEYTKLLALTLQIISGDYDKKFFEKIGLNSMKKAKVIENSMNNLIQNRTVEGKFNNAGKILSCLLNVYLN